MSDSTASAPSQTAPTSTPSGQMQSGQVPLRQTPLHDVHVELGARMVPFAGYAMPVQYPSGILAEHLQTRAAAGLFDVSHMGQIMVGGAGSTAALERLVPGDIAGLAPCRSRYTFFTSESGGILDDVIVTRLGRAGEDRLFLVVNAGTREADLALLGRVLPPAAIEPLVDRALLALQGPLAAAVLARLAPETAQMTFLDARLVTLGEIPALVMRSGYTGEDGFEISVARLDAPQIMRRLLAEPEVKPVGLGARDSLRLEAGLCLYGHDIGPDTTPAEAGLDWSIGRRRRQHADFPGAATILAQLAEGPDRRRVGLLPEGRQPAREGAEILDASGALLGHVTSGGFGPSLGAPVSMGYVPQSHAAPGTVVQLRVRGVARPARVAALPFVPPRQHRRPS